MPLTCKNRWAQQGSNLRPLACKTRTYRRRTWLDVARCGICQPRLWLDVAWRGLMPVDVGSPSGSPISLVPLTFNDHERRPEARHCSRPERPSGSDRGQRARCPATRPRRSAHQTAGTPCSRDCDQVVATAHGLRHATRSWSLCLAVLTRCKAWITILG
jgi:hypothetical protein